MIHDSGLQRFVYEGVGSVPLRESVSLVCGHLFVALSCSGLWVWPTVPSLHQAGRLDRRHQGRQKVSRKNSRRKTHALAKNQPHVFCFPCPQYTDYGLHIHHNNIYMSVFCSSASKVPYFFTAPPGRKIKVISNFSYIFLCIALGPRNSRRRCWSRRPAARSSPGTCLPRTTPFPKGLPFFGCFPLAPNLYFPLH